MEIKIDFQKTNKKEYVKILYTTLIKNQNEKEFIIHDPNAKTFEAKIPTETLFQHLQSVIINYNNNLLIKDKETGKMKTYGSRISTKSGSIEAVGNFLNGNTAKAYLVGNRQYDVLVIKEKNKVINVITITKDLFLEYFQKPNIDKWKELKSDYEYYSNQFHSYGDVIAVYGKNTLICDTEAIKERIQKYNVEVNI